VTSEIGVQKGSRRWGDSCSQQAAATTVAPLGPVEGLLPAAYLGAFPR